MKFGRFSFNVSLLAASLLLAPNLLAFPAHSEKGSPIPISPDATTIWTVEPPLLAWWTRMLLDPAIKAGEKDPKVIDAIKHGVAFMSGAPGIHPADLLREIQGLDQPGPGKPALDLLAGILQPDPMAQKDLLEESRDALASASWPKFVQFTAAANLLKNDHDSKQDPATLESAAQSALNLLRDALAEKPFAPSEMPILRARLQAQSLDPLLLLKGAEVCDIVEKAPGIDPWVAEYVQGRRYVAEAQKTSVKASSETAGTEDFSALEKNLQSAREHLASSWKSNPKDPGAATAMITVAMAEHEKLDTMRLWFDRAVAAEMDFPQAYKSFLLGLRPRLLGTYQEMIDFGGECFGTGRYDTIVPFQYIRALLDVSQDKQDHGEILTDAAVNARIQEIVAKYLEQKTAIYSPSFLHTIGAVSAFKAGKTDVARDHLKAIEFTPDPDPLFNTLADIPAMMQSLR